MSERKNNIFANNIKLTGNRYQILKIITIIILTIVKALLLF